MSTGVPSELQRAVVVPRAEDAGCLAVAVEDGVAELDRAVLVQGSVAQVLLERGPAFTRGEIEEELLRAGAPSSEQAAEDAAHLLAELTRQGLTGNGATAERERSDAETVALTVAEIERLAREVLVQGVRLRYRALGRSMRPVIPHGSVLDVVARPYAEVRIGDVALYTAGEAHLVAHRIVARRAGVLVARGDSCARRDEVEESSYLGVVRARITPSGEALAVSEGPRRWLGLASGTCWLAASAVLRTLVLRPLRWTFEAPSCLRAGLRGVLRFLGGAAFWSERVAARTRRPLDVARAALLTSEEKDEERRRLYARRSVQGFTALDENVDAGLTLLEEVLMTRYPLEPGRALVLGCGPGRECLALARRGFDVVGVDREAGMLARARERAQQAELAIDYRNGEVHDLRVDPADFDALILFSGLLNMALPGARRVELLSRCREHLRPGGRVLLTFLSAYAVPGGMPPGAGFWQRVNPAHEPGDLFLRNETVHVFRDAEELAAEARAAGFKVVAVERDQRAFERAVGLVRGFAVLERPA